MTPRPHTTFTIHRATHPQTSDNSSTAQATAAFPTSPLRPATFRILFNFSVPPRIPEPFGNTDGEIGGLTSGAAYSQAEVQALRDKCEELADDVRALSTLVHALRTALVRAGLVKGGA